MDVAHNGVLVAPWICNIPKGGWSSAVQSNGRKGSQAAGSSVKNGWSHGRIVLRMSARRSDSLRSSWVCVEGCPIVVKL